jgi:hypothetical protein
MILCKLLNKTKLGKIINPPTPFGGEGLATQVNLRKFMLLI